jgi:UDP-glucose 4-epimerase
MKFLITGGNGFVGRAVVRLLYDQHDVSVIDNLRFEKLRFSSTETSKFRLYQGDICDLEFVRKVINDLAPEVIVHLAAIHYIPECEQFPERAICTNVAGTVNLLSVCPSTCQFIFASSGAVYQSSLQAHSENDMLRPSDIYGYSKLHGENYVQYLAQLRGFSAVIVRLFNVIGPGETNPHVLPEIIAQLKSGRHMLQLGNTSSQRDYISVHDAARGFVTVALANLLSPGECTAVNLGTQEARSVVHLLEVLRGVSGIEFGVITDHGRLRKADSPVLLANRSKILSIFGWKPQCSLEETLRITWDNPDLPQQLRMKYQL